MNWPHWINPRQANALDAAIDLAKAHAERSAGGRDWRNVPMRNLCRALGIDERGEVGTIADLALSRLPVSRNESEATG